MALLRAVGPNGAVVGYEIREDFAARAVRNVESFLGPGLPYRVEIRDVYDGIDPADTEAGGLDRVVLDLPEPWRVLPHLPGALRQGGWLCAYTPSIVQAAQLVETLRQTDQYAQVETQEVLVRGWHIQGSAVRPEHQMVGHTGFLTVARLVEGRGT
jgi:tRNA (adenine57-N1/adenine58-N1)-methyltransferase catalytic subunit